MARAKVHQRQTPRYIDLRLTEGEADFLIGLTSMVSGSKNSPRKYASRIYKALERATGYTYPETDSYSLARGSVDFMDYGTAPKSVGTHLRDVRRVLQAVPNRKEALAACEFLLELMDRNLLPDRAVNDPHMVAFSRKRSNVLQDMLMDHPLRGNG